MSIGLTDELEVKTKKGKLAAAKQIFLEGDKETLQQIGDKTHQLENAIKDITATGGASTANAVSYSNETSGMTAVTAQGAIDELATKNKSQDATIAAKAEKSDVQSSVSELKAKNTSQDAEIAKKANTADVTSQMQAEQYRVNTELGKKFDKESILQEYGDAEDKVMSQKAVSTKLSDLTYELKGISINSETSISSGISIPCKFVKGNKYTLSCDGDLGNSVWATRLTPDGKLVETVPKPSVGVDSVFIPSIDANYLRTGSTVTVVHITIKSSDGSLAGSIGDVENKVSTLENDKLDKNNVVHDFDDNQENNVIGINESKELYKISYNTGVIKLKEIAANSDNFDAHTFKKGDIMLNSLSLKLRYCEGINNEGNVERFSDLNYAKDNLLELNGIFLRVIEGNVYLMNHIIEIKSITNSSSLSMYDIYYSSLHKKLKVLLQEDRTLELLPNSKSTICIYNNKTYIFDKESGELIEKKITLPSVTASVDNTVGNPAINVESNGDGINFAFSGIKGEKGETGERGATGLQGPKGDKGEQGNSGYSGNISELEIVNNLTDGGSAKALSAEQGKILSRWSNYNNAPLCLKTQNRPSLATVSFDNWETKNSYGSIETTKKVYDEVYGVYNEMLLVKSNNTSSKTDGGIFVGKLSSEVDMTYNVLRGSIKIPLDFDVTKLGIITISLYSNNKLDNSNRAYIILNNSYNSKMPAYIRGGVFHFCLNIPLASSNIGENFDVTKVTHVGINLNNAASSILDVFIGSFDVVEKMSNGGILTIVDNYNPNVPSMADYAYEKGIPLNLSIVPNWIGGSNHGTLEQIYKSAAQGHFIFNHTWNHQIYGGQSKEEVFEQVSKSERFMVKHGFIRGAKVLSNPSAAFDNDKYQGYMRSPAQMIYHHWSCYIHPSKAEGKCLLYYPYKGMERLLNISGLDSSFKGDFNELVPTVRACAKQAIEKGGIFVMGFHGWGTQYGGYMTDDTVWRSYIDMLKEEGFRNYTIDELLEGDFI